MSGKLDGDLRIGLTDAAAALSRVPDPFVVLFERGDLSIELYAPRGVDLQTPHSRDEIYVIATGAGVFLRAAERVPFVPGDVLFVPAGVEHRFVEFGDDFSTWVLFFGPEGGYAPGGPA